MFLSTVLAGWLLFLCQSNAFRKTKGRAVVPPHDDDWWKLPTGKVDASDGWKDISPGGETTCMDGSDYYFSVKIGDPSKLHIHFQGGGATWKEKTLFFTSFTKVMETPTKDNAFDPNYAGNPYKDYTQMIVNYCSGDVHIGDITQRWGDRSPPIFGKRKKVQLRGRVNALSALNYAKQNFGAANNIVVTGESAGSLATHFWTPWIVERFGGEVTVIADSFIGAMFPESQGKRLQGTLFERWGGCSDVFLDAEQLAACQRKQLTIVDVTEKTLQKYPQVRFATIDSKIDIIQRIFFGILSGDMNNRDGKDYTPGEHYKEAVLIAQRYAKHPNYWNYWVNGQHHTFMSFSKQFMLAGPESDDIGSETEGPSYREWTRQLISRGGEVPPRTVCTGRKKQVSRNTPVDEKVDYCWE